MVENKERYISKINDNRENYVEQREKGYIKNYQALRHKEQPKFRISELENVHNSNIKRETKYSGETDIKTLDN